MKKTKHKAIAIVGLGAIMPDARNASEFWQNIKNGRYSISDVRDERWEVKKYFDPDPKAPAKSYTKIGGWVHNFDWEPLKWKMPIPPKVGDMMDYTQKWAIMGAREALQDFGYPERSLNQERTAVIMGNAMGGDIHLYSASRILFPEMEEQLIKAKSFAKLPADVRKSVLEELLANVSSRFAPITEDTMPGELGNIIAGRIAAIYDFKGPNYIADAACASAMAAMNAAIEGLEAHDYDAVLTGGIDANMSASTYIKFCKIGALSATGTRPYDAEADGFVMGEGAAVFLLKRLEDAERDGDKIYAVIRGIGGSSDGKGKGITAPNPKGQKYAIERGWENAGVSPKTATLIEGHGTSTRVGDAGELESLGIIFNPLGIKPGSIALGSVKSNIGHLKGAAGAAGIFKATMALHEKALPPSLNFNKPNPNVDWNKTPFYVNTKFNEWVLNGHDVRRAGVSAFGFGGTNFHTVLEEYIPGRIVHEQEQDEKTTVSVSGIPAKEVTGKNPIQGALVIGDASEEAVKARLTTVLDEAKNGNAPVVAPPKQSDLDATVRLAIDYADAAELADKAERAIKAFESGQAKRWKALQGKGIYLGKGPKPKVAFLYPGQGSQYVNMLKDLRDRDAVAAQSFKDADATMTPLLGKPLSDYIFVDDHQKALDQAEEDLKQTEITQPAVLSTDVTITRVLETYGIQADMVMGHSLGEYGALVASGVLTFDNALRAVSARGTEMARVSVKDNGIMAAVFGPLEEIRKIVESAKGYVVIANINSTRQAVIGGETKAVQDAVKAFLDAGYTAQQIPVSHAFHTKIVAPASEPLARVLGAMNLQPPKIPVISNVTGEFYPQGGNEIVPQMLDLLSKQVASPVQFVKGMQTLYESGARVFVEVGPKRALTGFVEDVLGGNGDILSISTNHPKNGDLVSLNRALCGFYAAGLGKGTTEQKPAEVKQSIQQPAAQPAAYTPTPASAEKPTNQPKPFGTQPINTPLTGDRYQQLGHLFADFLEKGMSIYGGEQTTATVENVCITGAAIGLPGTEKVFNDDNIERMLRGDQFIKPIVNKLRQEMADKNITRLVKSEAGGPRFDTINDPADVIKLAARSNLIDLIDEFGFPEDRVSSLDRVTVLAIGAGLDALRDAGIPLQMRYKTTTKGTKLPDRWLLPDALRDDTGIIFASAFPGFDSFADEMKRFYTNRDRVKRVEELKSLRSKIAQTSNNGPLDEIDKRIQKIEDIIHNEPYNFDRRFLFKVLSMGHSQFAEYIGARGPNTQLNSACASTTQAVSLAQDWIQAGRCRRVVIISADDITTDNLLGWFGSGFLASGAAATDEIVENAAIPFDRRRHGMIIGMGGASLVVESQSAASERGIQPIADVLSTLTANSAFHGTRLDVDHIKFIMEDLIVKAEKSWGIDRFQIAPQTVFVSHETYTPARGGSAAAEINALRHVFGPTADQIVISNTKGLTGHAMGTGIEDVVAVKAVETSIVPPIANFKEVDPELGMLNLSKGGHYPIHYALRLAAGFGSQISMSLIRWTPTFDGEHRPPHELGYTYRIKDHNTWNNWMRSISGYESAELEVVKRTFRIKDQGPTARSISEAAEKPAVSIQTPVIKEPETQKQQETSTISQDTVTTDAVQERVLQLIAEKTGYPTDMLSLDLDLEADLGIDTVKQAEMFASVREAYDIERDDSVQLRDYNTLAAVIQFVYDKRPELKQTDSAGQVPPVSSNLNEEASSGQDAVTQKVLKLIAEKTGYPTDMLSLDLDLEADLGIDTVKQAEMFASVREAYDIERDDSVQLRDYNTLAAVIQFVYDKRPELKQDKVVASAAPTEATVAVPVQTQQPADIDSDTTSTGSAVEQKVLSLISEKTGYPPDMLDLDLDLEADLGIDTVKQAEMFASVREAYGIERDDSVQLRDYNTLASVIQFVYNKRPELKESNAVASAAQNATTATSEKTQPVSPDSNQALPSGDDVTQKVLELISEKTGYPPDMLDLDLDLEADLGIDTVKQAEMFASVREAYEIERDDSVQLRDYNTLAAVIQFVYDKRPELKQGDVTAPEEKTTKVPVQAQSTPTVPGEITPQGDEVTQKVLELISEKTGYPPDMLDLDLDLEADLGIDTVKQAEMFASVREAYDIERDDSVQLRDYNTLASVIQFVYDKRPELKGGGKKESGDAPVSAEKAVESHVSKTADASFQTTIKGSMEAANQIARRFPTPFLRPQIEICKDTGVKLDKDSRVILMSDSGGVGKALTAKLKKLGVDVLLLEGTLTADDLRKKIQNWLDEGPIKGVYWLPALDHAGDLNKMKADQWNEALRIRVKLLYNTMRSLYDQISAKGTFLVSATRMGGQHGYDETGALAPLGGAVSGFTKSYKREKNDVLVKVVDFEDARKTAAFADLLIAETLKDPGVVEVGYKNSLRWTIGLMEQPEPAGGKGMQLNKDSVFVITGAAGSITSAITADLAEASGGIFYLLDLAEKPDPNNSDIQRFSSDKENLKRDIFQRLKTSGERATPAMVEKELASIERSHAALSAIQAVEHFGGKAYYHSVNLLDHSAIKEIVNDIKKIHGKIDVLMHAGGLEISRNLPDKSPQEYDLVFDVKSNGWFNLMSAIGSMPLGAAVVFSSIAGRFGNAGQTDYSAANDLLCKSISAFRTTRPKTRGIAFDWTAWGGIGMAVRGSIPTIMKQAGIEMLPPEAGIAIIRRELTSGDNRGEFVVAKSLGIMMQEYDENGGLEIKNNKWLHSDIKNSIMIGKINSMGLYNGLTIERQLDPKEQPFLYDHQINNTPVLPGVMGIESMVESARIFFHDWYVTEVDQVNFMSPFKFYKNEPRNVIINVQYTMEDKAIFAHCRLSGIRKLHGQEDAQSTIHFTARVKLEKTAPKAAKAKAPSKIPKNKVGADDIYKLYFHGPAYQVIDQSWKANKKITSLLNSKMPANHIPEKKLTSAMPRLIELCFQTAGLLEMGGKGRMGLPYQIEKLSIIKNTDEKKKLYSVVSETKNGSFDAEILDSSGNIYLSLKSYRTMQLPDPIDEKLLKPLKEII